MTHFYKSYLTIKFRVLDNFYMLKIDSVAFIIVVCKTYGENREYYGKRIIDYAFYWDKRARR
jgi:hypothetical protein